MRILVLLLAAIIARAVMLTLVKPSYLGGDGEYYVSLASQGWAAMETGYRPPAYPLFISPLLALGGLKLVYAAQSLLIIGLGVIAYRWTGSLWAGMLIVTSPFFIIYEFLVLAEIFALTLLTLGWLVLSRPGPRNALIAGVLLAAASLARDTFILLPLFALPFGYWIGRLKDFAIVAVVALSLYAPWAIHISGGESRAGYNLWVGTWERNGDWVNNGIPKAAYPDNAFTSPEQRRILLSENRDGLFFDAAVDRIRTEPGFVVGNWIARYPQMWIGTRSEHAVVKLATGSLSWQAFKSSLWGLNLIILALGLWALWRHPFFAIPVIYVELIYVPFHNVETRYSLVVMPFALMAIGMAMTGRRVYALTPLITAKLSTTASASAPAEIFRS